MDRKSEERLVKRSKITIETMTVTRIRRASTLAHQYDGPPEWKDNARGCFDADERDWKETETNKITRDELEK